MGKPLARESGGARSSRDKHRAPQQRATVHSTVCCKETNAPRQGVVIPKGVEHRPHAPQRTVMLMFETSGIVPTVDE